MNAGPVQGYTPAPLEGTGGGATTSGTLYAGDQMIILEYLADVGGREERNTDIWKFSGHALTRGGIIRQGERTIWFEANMKRAT